MSHAFRSLALAAAVVALAPLSAHAALDSLTYNIAAGQGYVDGDTPKNIPTGVTITGAEINVEKTGETYLVFSGNTITITIDPAYYHLSMLTASFFSGADLKYVVNGRGDSFGSTMGNWSTLPLTVKCSTCSGGVTDILTEGTDWITSVTFERYSDPSVSDFAGIRSLEFVIDPDRQQNNVPEPGSYALAGFALLAAGAATRRRRQG